MSKSELSSCPFCGLLPVMVMSGNSYIHTRSAKISCLKCNVYMKVSSIKLNDDELKHKVITKWNKRTLPEPPND